ncbi:MAG: hypothetical protein AAFY47_00945 [Pseudomonadota bacterium]
MSDRKTAGWIKVAKGPTNGPFHSTTVYAILTSMFFALAIIAVLGVCNFAIHRAVMESGQPVIAQMPSYLASLGGRLTLVAEFAVLLVALLVAANGWPGIVWAYLAYSALNAMAAWLVLQAGV